MAGRLGDILIARGDLTQTQLDAVLSDKTEKGRLGARLLNRGLINVSQLGGALSKQFDVPFREISPQSINPQIVRLIPESYAREIEAVPIGVRGGRLTLAMTAPDDIEAISETELITGYSVEPVVSLESAVQEALDFGFDDRIVAQQTIVDMKMTEMAKATIATNDEELEFSDDNDSAPVVRLVRAILTGAIQVGASDIHLEPHTPEMRVRYRVDGELQQVMTIPNHIEESVVARIKVMADMDTTESRKPQDGHLTVFEDGSKVNFRVSAIPTVGGQKVVLRLLDEGNKVFDMETIGFPDREHKRVDTMLDKPHGMIVVTGPTGSGKSTTLYAMLTKLNKVQRNIVTVEDPVEYQLPGINQVQADNEFGMGFANSLKFIMRQDPDVIMVGEIRDHETATTAVQAALTGHLLISTLHTNDAVGSVQRLNDLGIDFFKIGGALLGSIAQRLLRSICQECKTVDQPNPMLLEKLAKTAPVPEGVKFFRGAGCGKCFGTGYAGRLPIFELMVTTPRLSDAIESGLPHSKLRELAQQDGMFSLVRSGIEQAVAGRTTLEEVYYKTS